jgi:hypothetical protein
VEKLNKKWIAITVVVITVMIAMTGILASHTSNPVNNSNDGNPQGIDSTPTLSPPTEQPTTTPIPTEVTVTYYYVGSGTFSDSMWYSGTGVVNHEFTGHVFAILLSSDTSRDMFPLSIGVTKNGELLQVNYNPDSGINDTWVGDFALKGGKPHFIELCLYMDNSEYYLKALPINNYVYAVSEDGTPNSNLNTINNDNLRLFNNNEYAGYNINTVYAGDNCPYSNSEVRYMNSIFR